MGIAADLRDRLADLLAEAGPDAPTLCEGWTTQRLAGHLIARERRPDAALGMALPPFAGWRERVERGISEQPYDGLVSDVRRGWLLTPFALPPVANAINAVEFAVHGEDVARAQTVPLVAPLTAAQQADLGGRLSLLTRLMARSVTTPFTLADADGRVLARHGGDAEPVALQGEPIELLLWLTGRGASAELERAGSPERLAALAEAKLGL